MSIIEAFLPLDLVMFFIENHIHVARVMHIHNSMMNCMHTKKAPRYGLLSQYQQTIATRNSRTETSRKTRGNQATSESPRVACSTPSNRNSSITAVTAEMVLVMVELHSRPSETDAKVDVAGWNSGRERAVTETAATKLPAKANSL
ncbi:hypothetical protein MAP00_006243 [Monascus purpureus]|nr:hypothetical protein MAP00_006243 [Monascus purpureus]